MGVALPSDDVVYCEMCGAPVDKKQVRTVFVEGALLKVCSNCYSKLMAKKSAESLALAQQRASISVRPSTPIQRPAYGGAMHRINRVGSGTQSRRTARDRVYERFELVEDYAVRIRQARERLGWSTRVLAMKVKESEATIKRIESGKLRPTIDLARRLEEVLGIKLLVPSVDEEFMELDRGKKAKDVGVTLGEIVSIREE